MDKRFRNLGIILVIILVVAFFLTFDFSSLVGNNSEKELEAGFIALAELTEEKGLDFNQVMFGELLSLDEEKGTYEYMRDELWDLNTSLSNFVSEQEKKMSEKNFEKFYEVVDLVSNKISLYEDYYEFIYYVDGLNVDYFCEDLPFVEAALTSSTEALDNYLAFEEKNLAFSEKHELSGLVIDSSFEKPFQYLSTFSERVESTLVLCGVDA